VKYRKNVKQRARTSRIKKNLSPQPIAKSLRNSKNWMRRKDARIGLMVGVTVGLA